MFGFLTRSLSDTLHIFTYVYILYFGVMNFLLAYSNSCTVYACNAAQHFNYMSCTKNLPKPEAEFMDVQFRRGFWA
jgi:hypothetical protein